MISPAEHEKVFRWLYETSKRVPFDIKTTAGQHYRRVVLQAKMREHQITGDGIRYEDVLMKGLTGQVDGLGRAPKGVNDGNGFVLFPISGMFIRAGCSRSKPETSGKHRSRKFTGIRRFSKTCATLINTKENAAYANSATFAAVRARGRMLSRAII